MLNDNLMIFLSFDNQAKSIDRLSITYWFYDLGIG